MIHDSIANYLVEQTIKALHLRSAFLKEKTVKKNSVRIVIGAAGASITMSYQGAEIAYSIYNNFLTCEQMDKITEAEFREEFERAVKCEDLSENLQDDIDRICKIITDGKLNFDPTPGNGEEIEENQKDEDEISAATEGVTPPIKKGRGRPKKGEEQNREGVVQ